MDLPRQDGRALTEVEALIAYRRAYWEALLRETFGNVQQAAKIAGVVRQTAFQLIHVLGLNAQDYRPPRVTSPHLPYGVPKIFRRFATARRA